MDSRVIPLAFAVGFFGDWAAQLLPHGQGLKTYFAQHGKFESMLIAGAALTLVFSLYYATRLEFTLWTVVILGVVIDLVARFGLIPSLRPFYASTGVLTSIIVAGIIPIFLVWLAQEVFIS
jgi:hypothetical protein